MISRVSATRNTGPKFAGDDSVQGAEAVGKLEVGQATLAVKPAEIVFCQTVIFLGVT